MTSVVRGLDRAMQTMDLERVREHTLDFFFFFFWPKLCILTRPKISVVMDKFENQLEDVDVQTSYMENTMSTTTASGMPQDQVDLLLQQVADENGMELHQQLGKAGLAGKVSELPTEMSSARRNAPSADQDEALAQRLRALRPAT